MSNTIGKILLIIILSPIVILSCHASQNSKVNTNSLQRFFGKNHIKYLYAHGYNAQGRISYYANKFCGRKTASGMQHIKYAYTAASLKLPLMSVLKVTNLENNKYIYILVNDRGPYKGNHLLDLSFGAAKQLDLISSRYRKVNIEFDFDRTIRLSEGDKKVYKELKLNI